MQKIRCLKFRQRAADGWVNCIWDRPKSYGSARCRSFPAIGPTIRPSGICEFQTPEEALSGFGAAEYAAIVLALPIAGWNGYDLLEAVQRRAPGCRS